MKHINLSLLIGKMLFVSLLFLTTFTSLLATSESEVITTIILIDRQAELVDVDQFGEILRRHVAVPDYFSSGRSHNSSLRKSLKMVKDYGQIKSDFFIPGSSKLSNEILQSFLVKSTNELQESSVNTKIFCTVNYEHSMLSQWGTIVITVQASQSESHFYSEASFREEKEQAIKKRSRKPTFSYNTKATLFRQRTRGHMRYYQGTQSYT